ncbi:MAG: ABC transporter permease [Candidatus Binatia bacterium]
MGEAVHVWGALRVRGRAFWLGPTPLVAVGGLALGAVAVLLLTTLGVAFRLESGYTLKNFFDLYGDPFAYRSLLNTLGFALVTITTALFFALPIAWLAERTDLPGQEVIYPLMTLGVLIPGFFTAMGWLFLFHPRIGMVNAWLLEFFPLNHAPFNITSVLGMGFVQGLGLSSLAFIMLAGSFRAVDPALEESAQIHGIKLLKRLRVVTLPLVWPGILATAIYVFMIGLAAFDVPAVIGMSNRIFTFSTFVFNLTNPQEGLPNYGVAAASSAVMIFFALLLSWWYLRVVRRGHRYAVIRGQGYRPKLVELGRWWVAGWAFIALKVILSLVLPAVILVWSSLLPFFEPFSVSALERISLANFYAIPWEGLWRALRNTAILVLVVPTLTAIVSLAISWIVIRSGLKVAGTFDTLAFIPHAVPGLIFALGALVLGLFWLPDFIPFYGTIYILIAVYVVERISFATRVYNTALIQIHRELDEVGYVFGLKPLTVVWKILRPLLAPALLYTWLWMALLTYRELTVAAFLVTRENITLPVFIWGIWTSGALTQAAAISVLLMLFMLPLVICYFLFGRQRLALGA